MLQKTPSDVEGERTAGPAPAGESPAATAQAAPTGADLAAADLAALLKKGRSRSWLRRIVVVAGLAVLAAGGWYWWTSGRSADAIAYTTGAVTRGGLTVTVTATGTIEPTNQVDVSSELSGTVESVAADFNGTVKRGQILATLKTDKLAAAVEQAKAQLAARAADVAQAQASAAQTRLALERAQSLKNTGVVTQETLDSAKAANDRSVAALLAAEANREIAEANLAISQTELGKAAILAPIDGVVLARNVEIGQTVAASLQAPVLFTIAEDLAKMQLEVDIDEADVGRVAEGDRANFTVSAFDTRSFPATVAQIRYASAKVEGVVTYKAILSVDNTNLLLRPGMTATAEIIVDSVENALLVPNAALRYTPPTAVAPPTGQQPTGLLGLLRPPGGGGGTRPTGGVQTRPTAPPGASQQQPAVRRTLWVLRDGEPVAVPVQVGLSDGTRTQILNGAISESDVVIVGSRAAS
jgi:HlyD family secretion protein